MDQFCLSPGRGELYQRIKPTGQSGLTSRQNRFGLNFFKHHEEYFMKKIALAIAALLFMLNAHASIHPIDAAQQTCLNKASTTLAMQRCFSATTLAWDKEMNQQYARLTTIMSSEQQAKLKSAQRAWLKYRDSWLEAAKARLSDGGSQAPLQVAAQEVALVKNQALALKSLTQSCGNPDECN
jgi:uncharacterized protein YecT (DUF1311 family)